MKQHGPWEIISTRNVYKNPWIVVREDKIIQPDGTQGTYGVIDYGSGVSILPLDDKGFVYLVEQFRYALGSDSLETAAGGIDKNEIPLDAAKRELAEELGITAKDWIGLGFLYSLTSIIAHRTDLFLAKKLSFGKPHPDPTEVLKMIKLPFQEAFDMVMESKIVHAPTCVLILKAQEYLRNKKKDV